MRRVSSKMCMNILRHGLTHMQGLILFIVAMGCLQGCGLLIDAAELLTAVPEVSDGVDVVCRHGRLHVGISVEPYPPFVFPVVKRPEGPVVTGLDLELVQQLGMVLSAY